MSGIDTTTRNSGLTNFGRSIFLADSVANKRINDSLQNRFVALNANEAIRTNQIMRGADAAFTLSKSGVANIPSQLIFKQTLGSTQTSNMVNSTLFVDTVSFSANNFGEGYSQVRLTPVLNQTGFTGVTRGLYVNPVLTGVNNFRAFESNVLSGQGFQFRAGGTAPNYFRGRTTIDSTWVFNHTAYFQQQTFVTAVKSNSITYYNPNSSMVIQKSSIVNVFPYTGDALRIFSFGTTNVSNSNWNGLGTYDSIAIQQNITTGSVNQFRVGGKITQTGFTGPVRGININTELVGTQDFRAIQTNNNLGTGYQIYAAGTATSFFGGNVGIGTTDTKNYHLAIAGNAIAERIVVRKHDTWPDYVFDSSYHLASLKEVGKFIQQNKHLPNVPSASNVQAKGLDIGDAQAILLRKIEELTLYIIMQDKELESQKKINSSLEDRLLTIEKLLESKRM